MKKSILIIILILNNYLLANINAVVSILPQQTFLKAIGKDKVDITLMVKPGNSPHTYEPKSSQMKNISTADIYFSIGVEFEKVWLPRFKNQNKKMLVSDISKNIVKTNDPHIWTSPKNVKIIAKNIYNSLIQIDAKNSEYYKNNYNTFIDKINKLQKEIKNILKNTPKNSKFMVFHPAWQYFATEYNLIQLAIEIDGKNPNPKTIKFIIDEAKKEDIKAIFTAPEFSIKTAKIIAKELNIKVIQISPLNQKWANNLIKFAKAIANNK